MTRNPMKKIKKTAAQLETQLERLLAKTPVDQQPQVLAEFIFGKGVQLT
jgi:hypothetical protein